jgi:transcriptional antiterminator RfaH
MNRWYVIHTQPRHEDRALWHLRNQGFECFLPLLRRRRTHARKVRTVMEPLFPGYLFAFFNSATTRWRSINGSRGVVQLLTDGAHPLAVPDGIVESLLSQTDAEGGTSAVPLLELCKGRRVRICDGAFAGQVAEVEAVPPSQLRIRLLLNLLGRVTRLQVPAHVIEPI